MSFIYNKYLLDEFSTILEKIAQQTPAQQIAEQTTRTEKTDPKRMQQVILEALQNLKSQYSNTQSAGKPLLPENLASIGSFANWLNDSGFTFNGKKVALPNNATTEQSTDPKYEPLNSLNKRVSIWKDGVIGALKDLQEKALQSKDLYFVEHINHLIGMANSDPELNAKIEEKEMKQETPVEQKPVPVSPQATQQSDQQVQPGEASQQGQYKQISQKSEYLSQVIEQASGTPIPVLPFDLNTNLFDIDLISRFNTVVDQLLRVPFVQQELYSYYSGLRSNISQLGNRLTAWGSLGAKLDAFPLNEDVDGFVTDVADKDYGKARDMLVAIGTICRLVSNILSTVLASPALTEQFGKERIDAARQKAADFARWAESMTNKISIMARK